MKEFRDDQGRPWHVALTVSSAARVKDLVRVVLPPKTADEPAPTEAVPFDLIDAGEIARTFQVLRSNFSALGETLAALLLPQIIQKGLSKEDFLDALRGESLEQGGLAVEEELVAFFPPRLRGVVTSLSARMTELADEVTKQAEAALRTPGPSSGSVQASPDSTQTNAPSES
jgi:hypothetical protein